MAFESLKAEFSLLFQEMETQPQDLRELYEMTHEKLNELRAMGMPVPEDLAALERRLDALMMPQATLTEIDRDGDGDADGDGGGDGG